MSALYQLPVFGLALTLTVYLVSFGLYHRLGRPGLLSPVLVSVVVIASVLQLTGMPYDLYLEQVALLTILLGPATVALALPLLRHGRALLSSAPAVVAALVAGGVVSIGATVGAMAALGADEATLRAALPRSVTSPVGLTIAESLQASVPLAVVLTLVSGTLGAVVGPALLTLVRVRDERARGFAIGLTSHGIGTSRVLGESAVAGGWSSAAMVLNALAMTVTLPLVAARRSGCARAPPPAGPGGPGGGGAATSADDEPAVHLQRTDQMAAGVARDPDALRAARIRDEDPSGGVLAPGHHEVAVVRARDPQQLPVVDVQDRGLPGRCGIRCGREGDLGGASLVGADPSGEVGEVGAVVADALGGGLPRR
jgi:putative effector of murein hydrolase